MRDKEARDTKLQILSAELDTLTTSVNQEREDLAGAVFGLDAQINQIGGSYEGFNQYNKVEQNLINNAETLETEARDNLSKTENSWFPLFKQRRINNAKITFDAAKIALQHAKDRAEELRRQRLIKKNSPSACCGVADRTN